MATVSIFLPSMSGTAGNTLWLRKSSDYSLVNTGGDALTESGTSGWFTATVEEAWTETLSATVLDTNSLASGYGWLAVGATQISDGTAVLDSAAQAQIDKVEAIIGGTVSGAGTDTEVFVGTNKTVTVTADSDGNRSAVVVS